MTAAVTDQRPAFTAKGRISAQAACEQIIEGIEPKDGITVAQVLDDVAELCGVRHERGTVVNAMRSASEALLGRGTLGVLASGPGWVRMDDAAAVEYAREHGRKAWRQVVRSAKGAGAADPEALSWEDRHSRDHFMQAARADQIRERKGRRLRSAPAPDES